MKFFLILQENMLIWKTGIFMQKYGEKMASLGEKAKWEESFI